MSEAVDNPFRESDPEVIGLLGEMRALMLIPSAQTRAIVNLLITKGVFSAEEHGAAISAAMEHERQEHDQGFREYLAEEADDKLKHGPKQ